MPMTASLTRSFLLLVLMAILGAGLAAPGGRNGLIIGAVLLLALAKARLILLDFMALRNRQSGMATACLGWCAALALLAFLRFWLAG